MKSRAVLTAAGALLLILAGAALLPRSKEAGPSLENPRAIQATPRVAMSNDRGPGARAKADAEPAAQAGELPDEERAVILGSIEQASVTYDSKALPLIEPYLLHPDPQVRLAAMNGMIVLGEAAAGPLLRKAAEKAASPKEAVALGEAADFVELPSGTLVLKDRVSPGTRKPREGESGERSKPRAAPTAKPGDGSAPPVE